MQEDNINEVKEYEKLIDSLCHARDLLHNIQNVFVFLKETLALKNTDVDITLTSEARKGLNVLLEGVENEIFNEMISIEFSILNKMTKN